MSRFAQWRSRAQSLPLESVYRSLAIVSRAFPKARELERGLTITRNLTYGPLRENLVDVYAPSAEKFPGPRPVVLYIHGGSFRILSKDTHWLLAALLASRGYLVFNIDYRLAPKSHYPAAIEDACAAFVWMTENAERYGGDLERVVIAGESAGANLAMGVTMATLYERDEPFTKGVFATQVIPRVVLGACGLYQVSDATRFQRRKAHLPAFVHQRLMETERDYLGGKDATDFADPLVFFERGEKPTRPFPAFFLPVGTRDPILDDTRRMAMALERLGADCEQRYYTGEVHAFHALLFRAQARECWRHTFEFLSSKGMSTAAT